ncbi:MAG: HEAT repeat domain-containing protein, partial [Isosphaeraceae bacterium]
EPLPQPAPGWSIELAAQAPRICNPTSIVVAADGTIYLGQGPSEKTGSAGSRSGSVLAIKDGKSCVFADRLGTVRGLEWIDGALYVDHPPELSSFRDTDRDGRADERIELVSGLGPTALATHGINDHIATGVRAGIDGYLYLAVGDKGVSRAVGKDGRSIKLAGGGVIRVRPDGTALEVVSTGERNPRSIALSASGEIFTLSAGDAGKHWPGGLTHHIVGGHYGYPYQFLTAPFRALPLVGGEAGEPGTQGVCYDEDGLPGRYRGSLFVCDWGRQSVVCFEIRRSGGTFAVARQSAVVSKGLVADFHPLALSVTADGTGFWLVDWANDAWHSAGPATGRLYRLTYSGDDRVSPTQRPRGIALHDQTAALDHPALSVRLNAQRSLARQGEQALRHLIERLHTDQPETGRLHALWALDTIGGTEARQAIREALVDSSASVRIQAARSSGIRADRGAVDALRALLVDRDPSVRREAAIALGAIGDTRAIAPLLAVLGEPDRFAAWSIRTAIRRLGFPDEAAMRAALLDARRRENALNLADESWSVPVVRALVASLRQTPEPAFRGRIVANLAGQFRKYPEWSGTWWGPDPLAGEMPRKTQDWNPEGMNMVLQGLRLGLADQDASVRFQSIVALGEVGPAAAPILCQGMSMESDVRNQALLVEALGAMNDAASVRLLTSLVVDAKRAEPVRAAALDGLARFRGRDIVRARLAVLYDPNAPESLAARALPPLARDGVLPPNDMAGFFESPRALVRAAALMSLNVKKPLPAEIRQLVLAREVRQAAVLAAGVLELREAVPRLIQTAGAGQADSDLRTQAISALCMMPDPRAEAIYRQAAIDPDPSLHRAGEKALQAIRGQVDPQIQLTGGSHERASGIETLRQFALHHLADPRKGEELFFENRDIACGRCHAAAGRGAGTTGPDLSGLASRSDKVQLIRSLLEPSPRLAAAHQPVKSLASTLTPLEFTDLIGFLERLKQPAAERNTRRTVSVPGNDQEAAGKRQSP